MTRRIFVALPLSEVVKNQLSQIQKEYPELPAKWVKPENLHITLSFLGNRSDEEVGEICSEVQKIAKKHTPLTLLLDTITYGPPEKTPRMVWATGETSEEFTSLAKGVQEALSESYTPITLHITLARLNQWEFQRISEEERIDISKDIHIKIPIDTVVVMESHLKRGGAQHIILQEAKLT